MSEQTQPDSSRPDGLDEVFARLEADIDSERGFSASLRALPRTRAAALVSGVILGVVGAWLWLLPRPDLGVYPKARLGLELGALAVLAMSAGWTFVRPLSRAQPRPGWIGVRLLAHVVVAAAIVSAPAAHHLHAPLASAGGGTQWWGAAGACLAVGSSAAVPFLVLLASLDRGGRGGLMPWLAPFGAWLVGMAVLQSHCPLLAHEHQWAGHFGLLLPVAFVWLLLRRRGVGQ